jgi:hypothetical protein
VVSQDRHSASQAGHISLPALIHRLSSGFLPQDSILVHPCSHALQAIGEEGAFRDVFIHVPLDAPWSSETW